MNTKTFVACPTCQKKIAWSSEEKYRPFCSERCKLIDLGEWAAEKNVIAGKAIDAESEFDSDDFLH